MCANYTRRRVLGTVAGTSITGVAGCESIHSSTPPSRVQSNDAPYVTELVPVVADKFDAYFRLSVLKREQSIGYPMITPVMIEPGDGIQVFRIIPNVPQDKLKEANVRLAIGLASEAVPIPGVGLAPDMIQAVNENRGLWETGPEGAQMAPEAPDVEVEYVFWLKSEQPIDDWSNQNLRIYYQFRMPGDDTLRTHDISPISWPACGQNTNQRTASPTETPERDFELVFQDEFDYSGNPQNNGWQEDTNNRLNGCPLAESNGDVLTLDAGNYNNCGYYRDISLGSPVPPRVVMRARSVGSNLENRYLVVLRISTDMAVPGESSNSASLVFRQTPGNPSNVLTVVEDGEQTRVSSDRLTSTEWQDMMLWYDGDRTYAGTAADQFLTADVSPPLSESIRVEIRSGNSVNEYDHMEVWRMN